MATTSYIDPATAWAAYALQDRTDESGSAVDDLNGEDMRIVLEAFTAGVLSADAFQVREGSPTPGMTVRVGSGAAKSDVAILEGTEAGQGKYMVRLGDGVTDVTVPAADVSNPRIDEVYLVVQDDPYDSNGGNVVPRIGYRQGDAAPSPTAPGPAASWTAYLLLATIEVGAGATEIENDDIHDRRVFAGLSPLLMSRWEIDAFVSHSVNIQEGFSGTVPEWDLVLDIPDDWDTWKCYASFVGAKASSAIVSHGIIIAGDSPNTLQSPGDSNLVNTKVVDGLTGTGPQLVGVRCGTVQGSVLVDGRFYVRAVRTS